MFGLGMAYRFFSREWKRLGGNLALAAFVGTSMSPSSHTVVIQWK